jgi:hypothetical protein
MGMVGMPSAVSAELRRGDFHLVLNDNEFVVCVAQGRHQRRRRRTRLGEWESDRLGSCVPARGCLRAEGARPLHAHPSCLRSPECSCSSDPSTSPSSDPSTPLLPRGWLGLESGVAEAGALEGAGTFKFRGGSTGRATDYGARLVRRCTDGLPFACRTRGRDRKQTHSPRASDKYEGTTEYGCPTDPSSGSPVRLRGAPPMIQLFPLARSASRLHRP